MKRIIVIGAAVLGWAGSASAQDEPRFCPNRPSLGSSACTTEPGHVQLEVSALDWQRDDTADQRDDTLLVGDFLARFGVGPSTEFQLGWSPYGHSRTRDKASGEINRADRVGDVRLAVRQNLHNPDGKGLSYGLEPFVTLPVGRSPIGSGTWGAGIVAPVTYDVAEKVSLGLTGEADAEPDQDGRGRHFAASATGTLSIDLSDTMSAYLEGEVLRDDDPADHVTQSFAATGLSFQTSKTRSLWVEAVAGLNHDSPDIRLFGGISALF